MYPRINRMGSYGAPPISYGPNNGPGKIPGYDLRVSPTSVVN